MMKAELNFDLSRLGKQHKDIIALSQQVNQFPQITSQEEYSKCNEIMTALKEKEKQLKKTEKELLVPINELHKKIKDMFRKPLELITSAYSILQERRAEWRRKEQLRIMEEERKRREEIQKRKEALERERQKALEKQNILQAELIKEEQAQLEKVVEETPQPVLKEEGVVIRKDYEVIVKDINAIPREYLICKPNFTALKSIARATEGKAKIPGVEFKEKEIEVRRVNGR